MRPGVGTCSLDTVFFNVSQEVAMLFRVARVALCDIPYVSEGMCVRNRRGTKVAVSREETAKSRLFQGVMTARCDMVSRGRHGA